MATRVVIMGAAGRDFHNFNVCFKGNPEYDVVAFTAAQIPTIAERRYPPELAGPRYPEGIPIYPEERLPELLRTRGVQLVVFSYSDVPHVEVMHRASMVQAAGADFLLLGAARTMLTSHRPVVAVCAVRTGCGKSQTTREVCRILRQRHHHVVAVRHPMPYGDLRAQAVQRFASYEDFSRQRCTIEEREEYEPLVDQGIVVYAGVDYDRILRAAEAEAEIIVWDGGNNDTPFYRPDVHIVLFDPHRAGHELRYYAGETNLYLADIALINKVDTAPPAQVAQVRATIERQAPQATIVLAASPVLVSHPEQVQGRRVVVVEDGPTLTHGEMPSGAGLIAAKTFGAADIVDPRPYAVGTMQDVYRRYAHIGPVLPAMGYSQEQVHDLERTINSVACDLVLCATPIQLTRLLSLNKPSLRVRYAYQDHGQPRLADVLLERLHL
jgi:predicted GTPase